MSATASITIQYQTLANLQLHWHTSLQIIYILNGKAKLSINGQQYILHSSDFVVINPYQLHNAELLGTSELLSFLITLEPSPYLPNTEVHCISPFCPRSQKSVLHLIRNELAVIFQLYFDDQHSSDLDLSQHIQELLHLLCTNFSRANGFPFLLHQSRLGSILEYLLTHYAKSLTLSDLAKQQYLSPNYLSQIFRDKLGVTFTDCLCEIRLQHSFYELCNTSKRVTDIALDNGFGRVDAFIEKFRKKYSITPGKYRKGIILIDYDNADLIPHNTQDSPSTSISRFQSLLKFAPVHHSSPALFQPIAKHITLSSRRGTPVSHDWNTIVNCGYADDCFTAEIQQQLTFIKSSLGFEYLRFHGIFSDSMHVYDEDSHGNPIIHFAYIDLLFDRLLKLGYKLFIEFSFLPSALATNINYVYQNRSYISAPKSLEKWCLLIRKFLTHCITRYGIQTVRQWKFSLFSISFSLYGFLSPEEYYSLYQATFQTVKSVSGNLCFCGPGFEGSSLLNKNDSTCVSFLKQCSLCHTLPDIITLHSFPHSFNEINSSFNRMVHKNDVTATFHLSRDEHFMAHVISQMHTTLQTLGLSDTPIIIDEWNSTIWQRDLCSDTCYKGIYVIKNMLETMGKTAGKAYWTVSDLINDWKLDGSLFHGGHGMLTYNGIPKPAFYAFQLLNHLGEECLSSGDGWYITRSEGHLQILLYHYCHYNALYRALSEFHDPSERYSAFEKKSPIEYHIHCSELFPHKSTFTLEFIHLGRNSGSALDEYNLLGAPSTLSIDELEFLRNRSAPIRQIERATTLDDISIILKPLEAILILVTEL